MQKTIRRKKQIQRNRTIILRSAKPLFHKRGYYAVTMEDIARHSGFDRRTIYNHFQNKDDIFAALINDIMVELNGIIEKIQLRENISSLDKLRVLVVNLLDLYIDSSQLLNIFMSEYKIHIKKKKKYISTYMLTNIDTYREIELKFISMIKKAQDDGFILDIHPYILAGALNELILRSVIVLNTDRKTISKDIIIKDILRVIEGNVIQE